MKEIQSKQKYGSLCFFKIKQEAFNQGFPLQIESILLLQVLSILFLK